MAIRLPLRIAVASAAFGVSYWTTHAAVAWISLALAAWAASALLTVEVPDEDVAQLVEDFRAAMLESLGSLKAAAISMGLTAPHLTQALAREKQVDLFWRELLLPVDAQREYHLRRLMSLGLPDRTRRAVKIAALVDPLTTERSA